MWCNLFLHPACSINYSGLGKNVKDIHRVRLKAMFLPKKVNWFSGILKQQKQLLVCVAYIEFSIDNVTHISSCVLK